MTTTPDEMAAVAPPPEWRGRGLPGIGRHVRLDYRVVDNGRTRWTWTQGIVGACETDGGTLTIMTIDPSAPHHPARVIALDGSYGLDKWVYTGDTSAEHDYRKATDPVYRHHSDTLDHNMGMARLRAEESARDFDNAVPAAVVEMVEQYGMNPADLDEAQRAVYEQHRTVKPEHPRDAPDSRTVAGVETTATAGAAGVPDPDARDIPGMLRRLQWLNKHIDSLEVQVKATRSEYAALNAETVREMAAEGMTSSTINGETAYFAPKQHVRRNPDVTPDDVLDALHKGGLGHMVKPGYNGQSLKAYLAELYRDELPVPEAIAAVVTLKTDYEIRFVRAAARKRRAPRLSDPAPGGGVSEDGPPLPTDPSDF